MVPRIAIFVERDELVRVDLAEELRVDVPFVLQPLVQLLDNGVEHGVVGLWEGLLRI